jgi:hypothetical protein
MKYIWDEEKCVKILVGKPEQRDHLEGPGVGSYNYEMEVK